MTKLRRRLPLLISIGAVLIYAYFLFDNAEKYQSLLKFSLLFLCLAVILILFTIIGNGLVNLFLYRGLGAQVGVNESIGLAAMNTLANLLPFAAGMATKGIYLKQRFRLSYSRYLSATLAVYIIFLTTAGLVGLMIVLGRWLIESEPVSLLLIVGFGLMAAGVVTLIIPLKRLPFPRKLKPKLLQLIEGWEIIGKQKRLLINTTVIYLLMMLATGGRYWVAFQVLSQDVPIIECIMFAAATILTQLVSLTPGGVGIREGVVAAVASVHGIPLDISVVAISLDRLVETSVAAVVGTGYSFFLGRNMVEKVGENSPTKMQIDGPSN